MQEYDMEGNEIKVDEKTEKATKAAFEQMKKKAILLALERRQFFNIPLDIPTSETVAKYLNVKDEKMIQVRKFLIDPKHVSKIRQLLHDANLLFWTSTRSWENMSYRVLSMEFYDDFIDSFTKISDEFEEAVEELYNKWDDIVQESKRVLGKAFNKKNYPDKEQIKGMFELKIETAEFPDAEDIRLNLSGPELMRMKQEVADDFAEGQEALLKLLESGDKQEDFFAKLIGVATLLNVSDNPDMDIRLAELKEKHGVEEIDSLPDEESMMVMDDFEKADFDDEAADTDDLLDLL